MQKPTDLKDVETCVRYILAHYPNARNNDKILMLHYWELIDKIQIPKQFWYDFLTKATSPETIRRTRQKIQEKGEYLPTPEAQAARESKKQAILKWLQKTL